jgi:hypothetical protein
VPAGTWSGCTWLLPGYAAVWGCNVAPAPSPTVGLLRQESLNVTPPFPHSIERSMLLESRLLDPGDTPAPVQATVETSQPETLKCSQ